MSPLGALFMCSCVHVFMCSQKVQVDPAKLPASSAGTILAEKVLPSSLSWATMFGAWWNSRYSTTHRFIRPELQCAEVVRLKMTVWRCRLLHPAGKGGWIACLFSIIITVNRMLSPCFFDGCFMYSWSFFTANRSGFPVSFHAQPYWISESEFSLSCGNGWDCIQPARCTEVCACRAGRQFRRIDLNLLRTHEHMNTWTWAFRRRLKGLSYTFKRTYKRPFKGLLRAFSISRLSKDFFNGPFKGL